MKQEKIHTQDAQERALVKLIPWSFAGLIDPLSVFANKHTPTLYWSQSRVYSPTLREWLTVDPMVKMDPQSLVEMPGNWNAVEYASGDPVNMVDTSGYATIFAGSGSDVGLGTGVRSSGGIWLNLDTSKNFDPFSSGYYTSAGVGAHYGMSAGAGFELGFLSGNKSDFQGISSNNGLGGGMLGKLGFEYNLTSTKAQGLSFSFQFGAGGAAYQRMSNTWTFNAGSDSFLGRATRFANDFYNNHFGSSKSWSDSNSDRYSIGKFNLKTNVKMD